MTVRFDTESGVLRLDQASFDSLVAWSSGGAPDGPELAALRQAGAIDGEHPHPDIADGLNVVAGHRCQFRLDCVDHNGEELSGDGWAAATDAALLLDAEPGLRDFLVLHPALIPVVVARIVHLGPRPRFDAGTVRLPRDVFAELLGATAWRRASAAERYDGEPVDVIGALVDGPWLRWTVTANWHTPDGDSAADGVEVVDTAEGLWSLEVDGATVSLRPTDTTAIWRRLSGLVPAAG